jgi:hypothetical protein
MLAGWTATGLEEAVWAEKYGTSQNTSFIRLDLDAPTNPDGTNSLIDEGETYNWPNPITEGVTRIRVKTRESCEIRMTVVDLSGALVYESILGSSFAGVPSEFEWRPEVASGVYYARIEAVPPAGDSESTLIRIAVVR